MQLAMLFNYSWVKVWSNFETDFECPLNELDFNGNDIKFVDDVVSWEACGKKNESNFFVTAVYCIAEKMLLSRRYSMTKSL